MQPDIVQKLTQINHKFYQSFASHFSNTRQRLQPGVQRLLPMIQGAETVLDMGCGNGNLALELADHGFEGQYVGIDASPGLIEIANQQGPINYQFYQRDLSKADWSEGLPHAPYDLVLCFATLHHIPGEQMRLAILEQVFNLLKPGGKFIHSNWQPQNSARLRERIQPWSRVGLDPGQLDAGDLLIDWRRGGEGLRYVHEYSQEELHTLADKTGFIAEDIFSSDGDTGDLGLYMIWQKPAS